MREGLLRHHDQVSWVIFPKTTVSIVQNKLKKAFEAVGHNVESFEPIDKHSNAHIELPFVDGEMDYKMRLTYSLVNPFGARQ